MDRTHIEVLLSALGVTATQLRDNWVNCSCPFAKYNHKGGTDNNPSFGICINTTGESTYKCWSCGEIGGTFELVQKLQYLSQKNDVAMNLIDWEMAYATAVNDEEGMEVFPFKPVDFEEEKKDTTILFSEAWLKSFPSGIYHPYLATRGISPELATEHDIRFDSGRNRLCVPIRDWEGTLMGMQGREVRPVCTIPYLYYTLNGQSNPQMWIGEDICDPDQPVVFCEGLFDYLNIVQVYPNCLASMTSALSPAKLKEINSVDQIITFYDYGTGGDTARYMLEKRLGKKGHIMGNIIPTELEGDPGNMSLDSIREALYLVMPQVIGGI